MILMIFFVAPVLFTGCNKESLEPVTELPVDGTQKVIKVEENGIGIEFCLVNEQGEPATVFQEGENFRFRLTLKNNVQRDSALYIVSDFLRNPDLFAVYKENGDSVGKPVQWYGMNKISDAVNRICIEEAWTLEFPWHEERGAEEPFDIDNCIRVLQYYFKGCSQPYLPKGRYYTAFTQQFCLGRYLPHPQHEEICTDTLRFKIHFEIK